MQDLNHPTLGLFVMCKDDLYLKQGVLGLSVRPKTPQDGTFCQVSRRLTPKLRCQRCCTQTFGTKVRIESSAQSTLMTSLRQLAAVAGKQPYHTAWPYNYHFINTLNYYYDEKTESYEFGAEL